MIPHLPDYVHALRFTRREVTAIVVAAVVGAGAVVWYALTRKEQTPEERELVRRTLLAAEGRITDGSITGIDSKTEDTTPSGTLDLPPAELIVPAQTIIYRYRISGVIYECGQDVSQLGAKVHHLRIDLPVQVRYDPQNPGNSIVVAENWSGLQQEAPGGIVAADCNKDGWD